MVKTKTNKLTSRNAHKREILLTLVFAASIVLFLALMIVKMTSKNQAYRTFNTSAQIKITGFPTIIIPSGNPTPTPIKSGVWSYSMTCVNGTYSYVQSTNGQYTGSKYCVDITVNGSTTYSGCGGWTGTYSHSGPYNSFYYSPNTYKLRGRIYTSDRKRLLVDQSISRECRDVNGPTPTRAPSNFPTIAPTRTPTPPPPSNTPLPCPTLGGCQTPTPRL